VKGMRTAICRPISSCWMCSRGIQYKLEFPITCMRIPGQHMYTRGPGLDRSARRKCQHCAPASLRRQKFEFMDCLVD
jgi:hypothetical protein